MRLGALGWAGVSEFKQPETGCWPASDHTHKQLGRAAGMDGGGARNWADEDGAFKRRADSFSPGDVLIVRRGVPGERGLFLRGA